MYKYSFGNNVINITSAENFYGNVATIIGGDYVKVTNIMNNINVDPHSFNLSPKMALKLSNKNCILISNGSNYDTWVKNIIHVMGKKRKILHIDVSKLLKIKENANPHIWYNPNTFLVLANSLATIFSEILPNQNEYFQQNLEKFNQDYKIINTLIDNIRSKFSDVNVIATESVFNYMIQKLNFNLLCEAFQLIIMNGAEPSPKTTIEFQKLLEKNVVKILFYNKQVNNKMNDILIDKAKDFNVALIGINEIMPNDYNVISWLKETLENTNDALDK